MQQGREEDRGNRRRLAENGHRAGGIGELGESKGPEGSRDEPGQGVGNPEVLQTGRILLGPALGSSTALSYQLTLPGSSLLHFPVLCAHFVLALPLRVHPEGKYLESGHEEGSNGQSLAW